MSSHPHNAIYIHDMGIQEGTRHSRLLSSTRSIPNFDLSLFFYCTTTSVRCFVVVVVFASGLDITCVSGFIQVNSSVGTGWPLMWRFSKHGVELLSWNSITGLSQSVLIVDILNVKQSHLWTSWSSWTKTINYVPTTIYFLLFPPVIWLRLHSLIDLYPFLLSRLLGEEISQSLKQNVIYCNILYITLTKSSLSYPQTWFQN